MDRTPVESGNIKSIGYDPDFKLLEVEFTSLAVYSYKNVPPNVYADFMRAESKTQFFATWVRANYEYECIFKPEKKKEEASAEIPNPDLEKDLKKSIKQAKSKAKKRT